MGASKHIVQDKVGFVEFHRYPVGSQSIVLGNRSEEDILGVGTCQLKLRGWTKLLRFMLSMGLGCVFVFYL